MAKDYFQDIVPPGDSHKPRRIPINGTVHHAQSNAPDVHAHTTPPRETETPVDESDDPVHAEEDTGRDRSIRDINITPSRPRRSVDVPPPPGNFGMARGGGHRRRWLWLIAFGALIVLAVLLLLALRATSVTVTPRTHTVVFDSATEFTAYPALSAASGTLAYSVQTVDLEDSDAVQSNGTVHAETKASGSVTVYNNYSASPVKLIKNTRFASANGLIFRAPADVVVPGKTASGAGSVSVTVVADQAGDQYNVDPQKFTLPGLKGSDMFGKVYAQSATKFSGGFVGDKPGVSDSDMQKAVGAIRDRLESKAHDAAAALDNDANAVFPDLMQIAYEDEPLTQEAGGSVRIHEKAHVSIPVFTKDDLARTVAESVSSDADSASVRLLPGDGFGAHAAATTTSLGTAPLTFTLTGKATIVWNIDTIALAKALAGKDQGAFQTVVTGFPAIQEAHARIEPFWANAFPKDPAAIKVKVVEPAN